MVRNTRFDLYRFPPWISCKRSRMQYQLKRRVILMNVSDCITDCAEASGNTSLIPSITLLIDSIVSMASYSPSWKNTQITRYIAIDDPSILKKIADDCTPVYNSNIIQSDLPCWLPLLLSKAGAVLNVTVPILAQKRETVGRCSTLVACLPVFLPCCKRDRDLAL